MATKLQIWNMALSHLNLLPVIALEENTLAAQKCSLFYERVRDETLRDHPWSFAEKRELLSLISGFTPTGYTYGYAYPGDCVQTRRIHRELAGDSVTDYVVNAYESSPGIFAGKAILTNEADAKLIYTVKITLESMFDASFVMALSWNLAANICMPLRGKPDLLAAAISTYTKLISKAKTADAVGEERGTEQDLKNTTFTGAR